MAYLKYEHLSHPTITLLFFFDPYTPSGYCTKVHGRIETKKRVIRCHLHKIGSPLIELQNGQTVHKPKWSNNIFCQLDMKIYSVPIRHSGTSCIKTTFPYIKGPLQFWLIQHSPANSSTKGIKFMNCSIVCVMESNMDQMGA
jgi:hypothetical protein